MPGGAAQVGSETRMRPSEGRLQLWPVAVFAFAVVLGLLSFSLNSRLTENAPREFRELPVAPGFKANPDVANEYWRSAVAIIQWKFPFGTMLPDEPPPEFRLLPGTHTRTAIADAARQQYWNKLRQLWSHPELWQRKLDFDVSWAGRAVLSVKDSVMWLSGR